VVDQMNLYMGDMRGLYKILDRKVWMG